MSNWEMVRLGDVCEAQSSSIAQKDLLELAGDCPIYGASGFIKNVDFYKQECAYIAIVKDGAGIGRASILPAKSSVIGTMQYIIPKETVCLSYLFYAITHMNLAKYFSGATIPHIYFKDYKQELLPLPLLEEQKKIANELDEINDLIAKRKEQIEKLDLLVKAKFIEMFGDPVTNPMGWKKNKLMDALSVQPQNGLYKPASDYVEEGGGVAILRIDAFYNGKVTDYLKLKRLICTEKEVDKYRLKENDVVINRVNSLEYLGKCAHITGLPSAVVFESNMMRMHFYEERYNAFYITHLLCTKFIYEQILGHAKKAVNQASINQKDVQDFNIYCPPIFLQNQFADYAKTVEQNKTKLQASCAQLELLYKQRMQYYFE